MTLSQPIRIRLHEEQYLRYETTAARHGKPLATYIRECLENHENEYSIGGLKREFLFLKHMLEDLANKPTANTSEKNQDPMMLEIVLLLRQLAKPEHVRIAQGELKRLGMLVE